MKVIVKTIGGLHYLYIRDRNLRQCFLPQNRDWAQAVADRMNSNSGNASGNNATVFSRVA